jgi:hypothetical protein
VRNVLRGIWRNISRLRAWGAGQRGIALKALLGIGVAASAVNLIHSELVRWLLILGGFIKAGRYLRKRQIPLLICGAN